MKEVEMYSFDNKNYFLLSKIGTYLYLSNEDNPKDIMIRKVDPNHNDVLLPLDSDEEFEDALLLLTRKKGGQE